MASDVQSLLADARELAADGEFESALERYAELCDREPYNPDFWLERAGIAESAGRVAEAADMIFHVVDLLAAAGMGEAPELALRILALVPEHQGARRFLEDVGRGRSGRPGDLGDADLAAPDAVPASAEDGALDDSGEVSGVVSGMVYDSLPAIEAARSSDEVPESGQAEGGAIPRPIIDQVSDGVPVAVVDEPSGWSAASVPLPTVDMPSGPVAVAAIRQAVSGERRGLGDVRYSRPRPATTPGVPAIDLAERLTTMSSPLLDVLGDQGRQTLLAVGMLHRRRRHEAIFHQGDIGSSLYLVLEGRVDVERHDPVSGTIRRLATLDSGAFFGEMSLVAGISRSATVRAATDVVLFKVSRQNVRELSKQDDRLLALLARFFRARLVGTLMATSPLFRPLSAGERRALVTRLKLRELPADRVVLRQGRAGDGLYLVLLGALVVSQSSPDAAGTELGELGELGPGDVFGEMSSLTGEPAMATVRTREHVWLLRLPVEDLERLTAQHPEVRDALHEIAEARRAKNREVPETADEPDDFF